MAPENDEIVKGLMEAAERGDSDTAMEAFDPAVELDQTRFPDGGTYKGRDGVREFYDKWFGTWDELRIESQSVIELPRRARRLPDSSQRSREGQRSRGHPGRRRRLHTSRWEGDSNDRLPETGRSARSRGPIRARWSRRLLNCGLPQCARSGRQEVGFMTRVIPRLRPLPPRSCRHSLPRSFLRASRIRST
jgi:hypothetical protein